MTYRLNANSKNFQKNLIKKITVMTKRIRIQVAPSNKNKKGNRKNEWRSNSIFFI